jgi:hypothetical protein
MRKIQLTDWLTDWLTDRLTNLFTTIHSKKLGRLAKQQYVCITVRRHMAWISGTGYSDHCFPHQCNQACVKIDFSKKPWILLNQVLILQFHISYYVTSAVYGMFIRKTKIQTNKIAMKLRNLANTFHSENEINHLQSSPFTLHILVWGIISEMNSVLARSTLIICYIKIN